MKVRGGWILNDPAPNFATELMRCQGLQLFGPMTAPRYHTNNSVQRAFISTPVTMRGKPTIIGDVRVYAVEGNTPLYDVTVTVNRVQSNGVVLDIAGTTVPCYVYFPPTAGLDANL